MGMVKIRKNRVSAHLAGCRVRMPLNVLPYLATRYLLPRLSGFRGNQPQFNLGITTMVEAPDDASELAFHDATTMRYATLSGMGIDLATRADAEHDILAGALVAPLGVGALRDMTPETVPGFYLVLPRAHRRVSGIASFCDWVTGQNWEEATGWAGACLPLAYRRSHRDQPKGMRRNCMAVPLCGSGHLWTAGTLGNMRPHHYSGEWQTETYTQACRPRDGHERLSEETESTAHRLEADMAQFKEDLICQITANSAWYRFRFHLNAAADGRERCLPYWRKSMTID